MWDDCQCCWSNWESTPSCSYDQLQTVVLCGWLPMTLINLTIQNCRLSLSVNKLWHTDFMRERGDKVNWKLRRPTFFSAFGGPDQRQKASEYWTYIWKVVRKRTLTRCLCCCEFALEFFADEWCHYSSLKLSVSPQLTHRPTDIFSWLSGLSLTAALQPPETSFGCISNLLLWTQMSTDTMKNKTVCLFLFFNIWSTLPFRCPKSTDEIKTKK